MLWPCPLFAADKKPLDHTVYDGWKKISSETIANDGTQGPVRDRTPGRRCRAGHPYRPHRKRAIPSSAAPDRRSPSIPAIAAFIIKAPFAETKKAKIAKKKPEQMPKDTLAILRFDADSLVRIPRVKSFKFPEKGAGWIAYQLEKDSAKADTAKKKTDAGYAMRVKMPRARTRKKIRDPLLIIRRLEDGQEFRYQGVTDYVISKPGTGVLFACTGKDSTVTPGVFRFDTRTASPRYSRDREREHIKAPAWDDAGGQAAFLADRDTSKAKQRYFALCYWRAGMDSARILADTTTPGVPDEWLISENRVPDFSRNGTRLYCGTAPVPIPEDTTLNDEETAKLDVWNWQDPYLQSHQNKNVEQERKAHVSGRRGPRVRQRSRNSAL